MKKSNIYPKNIITVKRKTINMKNKNDYIQIHEIYKIYLSLQFLKVIECLESFKILFVGKKIFTCLRSTTLKIIQEIYISNFQFFTEANK